MNLGIAAYRDEDYTLAEKIFAECTTSYPSHMPALRYLALSQIRQGKLDDALINLEKIISLDPKYGKAYLDIAEIQIKKGNLNEAAKSIENALSIDDKLPEAWQMLGELYLKQKKYKRALTAFQNAILYNPNSSMLYELIGKTYLLMGDTSKARYMIQKSLDIDKNNTHALEYLGDIYVKQGEYEKAIECYQRILDLGVKSYIVMWKIGIARYKLREYSKALQSFLDALKIKTTYKTLISVARTYYVMKKFRYALTYLEMAQKLKPKGYLVMKYKAMVLPRVKRTNEAMKLINELLARKPDDVGTMMLKARIERIYLGNLKKAEKTLLSALKTAPKNTKLRYELGVVLYKQKKYKEAQRVLEEIKDSNNPMVLRLLGLINFKHRNYIVAMEYFKDSLEIYKKLGDMNKVHNNEYSIAITLFEMKKYKEAFEAINKLIQEKKKERYLVFAGKVLLKLKKYKEAVVFLEEALKMNPQSESAAYFLARAYLKLGKRKQAFKALLPVVTSKKSLSRETFILMADLYYTLKDYKNAARLLEKIYKMNPKEIPIKFKLGKALCKAGEYQKALEIFNELKQNYRKSPKLWRYLGICYLREGLLSDAENAFKKAIELGAKKEDLEVFLIELENSRNKKENEE